MLHLVDGTAEDVWAPSHIRQELKAYGHGLVRQARSSA